MEKNSTRSHSPRPRQKGQRITIGMDLGDRTSRYCELDEEGNIIRESSVATTRKGLTQLLARRRRCRIAIEVGTHSPWVSRLLQKFGHEVLVANARQVQLITQSSRKHDRLDAQTLARLARVDPALLRPIRHRSQEAQQDLMVIRVRAGLVEARTALVNQARGLVKALGERLASCDADQMGVERLQELPAEWQEPLRPLLEEVESLTAQIRALDQKVEQIARTKYPETELLRQISGVGYLIALTFVLTLEDRQRFAQSRDVGCYLGLRPKRRESGESAPQLRISKEGDRYLRQLLVQAAHHILGRRGPDTDLKRWGQKLCERGGRNAKKRAIVAVARKLAVLLHRLWVTGEVYEPLRHSQAQSGEQKAA